MKQFIALSRKSNSALHRNFLVGLLLVSFGLVGCGGQLGKIEPSAVDTAIADAEAAVVAAREVDAPSLAAEAFADAESNLEAAKIALTEKKGDEALRLAYQAVIDARVAHRDAVNIAKNSELNAALLQKEAGADELREKLTAKERELAEVRTEIQDMHLGGEKLGQTVSELQKKNRELVNKRKTYSAQVAELSKTLEEIQVRARRAETEIRKYGRDVSDLRRKLEVAERMAKEEGHQKRAVVAEINSLRRQLREQAAIYTEKFARATQQDANAEHQEYLQQKAQEAHAYVDSQPALHPPKTGRTSLSAAQIAAGKAALSNWEHAWYSKNLNAHLSFYTPDIVADKVVIHESKEHRNKIDGQQLQSDLREMNAYTWSKVKTDTQVEGESVIGINRLTRLIAPAADADATALYNIWIREVWMHQIGNDWRIHHEIWQIYENVPNF
jgi:ketosteroid isomerase-like protein/uncharacterized protein YoxC